MQTHGIDESGRGPLVGPLVVCIASFEEDAQRELLEIGVTDCKAVPKKRRESMAKEIEKLCEYNIEEITASELNRLMARHSLNEIEAMSMARLMKGKKGTVYIDLPARRPDSFLRCLGSPKNVVAEHKADFEYPCVSAASVLAKVRRDMRIRELQEEFGDFGSGYTSDRKTISFLQDPENLRAMRPYLREKWSTMDRLFQVKLIPGSRKPARKRTSPRK